MAQDADRHAARVSDAFDRCPDCGTFVVQLATHRCPSGRTAGSPVRERREALAEADDRGDAALVGLFQRSQGDAYAYHELDGGEPVCGCAGVTKAATLAVVTRAEAKARGKSPCGSCRRIEERRRRGDG
jgi:hypothetical protein